MSHEKTRHSASEPASLQAAWAGQLDAPLRAFVGYNIKRASEALRAHLNRVLKRFDLKIVTYSALTIICEHPGISQTQLADALSIERTRVVLLVDELEERGLITREKVRADRRAHSLEPTLHGRRL